MHVRTSKSKTDPFNKVLPVKLILWKAQSIKNCHFMTAKSCHNYRETISGQTVSN